MFMEQTPWEWSEQTAGLCCPGTCSPDKGQSGEHAQGQGRAGRRQPQEEERPDSGTPPADVSLLVLREDPVMDGPLPKAPICVYKRLGSR